MSRERDLGTELETAMARFFGEVYPDVLREPPHGSRDVGDIHGVTLNGLPVVIECKNYRGEYAGLVPGWLAELEREMANAGTPYGMVIAKRRGHSLENDPGGQFVFKTTAIERAMLGAEKGEE